MPGNTGRGVGKKVREGKGVSQGVSDCLHCGHLGLDPTGDLWEPVNNTWVRIISPGEGGCLSTKFYKAGGCSGVVGGEVGED